MAAERELAGELLPVRETARAQGAGVRPPDGQARHPGSPGAAAGGKRPARDGAGREREPAQAGGMDRQAGGPAGRADLQRRAGENRPRLDPILLGSVFRGDIFVGAPHDGMNDCT